MANETEVTFTNALKLRQQGYIEKTQNLFPMLLNIIPKGEDGYIAGKGWQPSMMTQQNESVTAYLESDTLPDALTTEHEVGLVKPKLYAARYSISGLLKEISSKGDRTAYASAMNTLFKGTLRPFRKTLSANCFEDGLAKLGIANGAGAATATFITSNVLGTSRLRQGMFVDVYDGTTKEVDNIEITGIDPDGVTFYFDSVQTWSDAAEVCRAGIRGATGAVKKAIDGLEALFDNSSDYHGVDRTVTPVYSFFSKVLAVGGTIDELSLQRLTDRVLREHPEMNNQKVMITERAQQRRYWEGIKDARRFMDTQVYKGGYSSVQHENIRWITDDDCAKDVAYVLCLDLWKRYSVGGDIRVADDDGLTLRQVANKDQWESWLKYYGNIACFEPRLQGKLSGLSIGSL